MHNGDNPISMVSKYGIMEITPGKLAPEGVVSAVSEHANCLYRTMHILYFKVCHLQASPISMVSKYGTMESYGIMESTPGKLAYFQLAPNMQIACIELFIYVISKSVYDRPGCIQISIMQNGFPYGK